MLMFVAAYIPLAATLLPVELHRLMFHQIGQIRRAAWLCQRCMACLHLLAEGGALFSLEGKLAGAVGRDLCHGTVGEDARQRAFDRAGEARRSNAGTNARFSPRCHARFDANFGDASRVQHARARIFLTSARRLSAARLCSDEEKTLSSQEIVGRTAAPPPDTARRAE